MRVVEWRIELQNDEVSDTTDVDSSNVVKYINERILAATNSQKPYAYSILKPQTTCNLFLRFFLWIIRVPFRVITGYIAH
jgi:hypothetical protein